MKKASRIVVLMLFAGLISLSVVGCKKDVPPAEPDKQAEMMEAEKIENEKKEAEKNKVEENKDEKKSEHPAK